MILGLLRVKVAAVDEGVESLVTTGFVENARTPSSEVDEVVAFKAAAAVAGEWKTAIPNVLLE